MPADKPKDDAHLIVNPSDRIGIVVAVLSAIIYGLYPPASRAAYVNGANAVFVVYVTTLMRVLMLVGFCFVTRKPLFTSWSNTKQSAIGGFWQAVP